MCRRSVRVYRRVRAVELNRFGVLFDGLKFLKEGRKGASSSSASASLMNVLSRAFFNEHVRFMERRAKSAQKTKQRNIFTRE